MITMKELVGESHARIPADHNRNLQTLFFIINRFRELYGKPLKVTSGYRDRAQHLAIYRKKGIIDLAKIPMKSNHLFGNAVDVVPIEDDIKHLHLWIDANLPLMVDLGLYFESFRATPTWVHAQIVPPKSGKRFFLP